MFRSLEAGATVDAAGGLSRSTPLLLAARNGHRAICEALLDAGADPALEDAYGESAQTAAEAFEVDAKLGAADFAYWRTCVDKRAAAIAAEPPPPVPLFPLKPREDLERWYRSTDPTKMLWRPGAWMHQKRPATGAVVIQQRPRAFSATGYAVDPVVISQENSTLPAEKFAQQAELARLEGLEGTLAAASLARERTTLNPQVFNDDVKPTSNAARANVMDAASSFRAIEAQEAHLARKFPSAPTHLGRAPVYSSFLQSTAMAVPNAATSIHPMLDEPPPESLSALLRRKPPEPEPTEEEAQPPEPETKGGKKK